MNTHTYMHKHLHYCVYIWTGNNEQFLVIPEAKAKDMETLKTSLELLETSKALVPLLDRNIKVILIYVHKHICMND